MTFRIAVVAALLIGSGVALAEDAKEPPDAIEQVLVIGSASVTERLNGVGSASDHRRRDAAAGRADTYI